MRTSSLRRAAAVVLASFTVGCAGTHLPAGGSSAPRTTPFSSAHRASAVAWPAEGQASFALDGQVFSSPGQHPVPIASLAKVMTAYVTVHRLRPSSHLVVGADDVADTRRREGRGESVVAVAQ